MHELLRSVEELLDHLNRACVKGLICNPLCLIKLSFWHIPVALLAPSPILFTIISQYMEMNIPSQLDLTHSDHMFLLTVNRKIEFNMDRIHNNEWKTSIAKPGGLVEGIQLLVHYLISESLVSCISDLHSCHVTWRPLTHYHVVSTALIRYSTHFLILLWNSQGQKDLINTLLGG